MGEKKTRKALSTRHADRTKPLLVAFLHLQLPFNQTNSSSHALKSLSSLSLPHNVGGHWYLRSFISWQNEDSPQTPSRAKSPRDSLTISWEPIE